VVGGHRGPPAGGGGAGRVAARALVLGRENRACARGGLDRETGGGAGGVSEGPTSRRGRGAAPGEWRGSPPTSRGSRQREQRTREPSPRAPRRRAWPAGPGRRPFVRVGVVAECAARDTSRGRVRGIHWAQHGVCRQSRPIGSSSPRSDPCRAARDPTPSAPRPAARLVETPWSRRDGARRARDAPLRPGRPPSARSSRLMYPASGPFGVLGAGEIPPALEKAPACWATPTPSLPPSRPRQRHHGARFAPSRSDSRCSGGRRDATSPPPAPAPRGSPGRTPLSDPFGPLPAAPAGPPVGLRPLRPPPRRPGAGRGPGRRPRRRAHRGRGGPPAALGDARPR